MRGQRRRAWGHYGLYGLSLRSSLPLPAPERPGRGRDVIELTEAPASLFDASDLKRTPPDPCAWFHYVQRNDGSDYLRWAGLLECLVSADGRRIACHALDGTSLETFQTYLLAQALSFALLKRGFEPLHATVVEINEQAVAFLGDGGAGKSTLGAAFLRAGQKLLTDDLLLLRPTGGRYFCSPGPPRLKLFPNIAKAVLGTAAGVPMNPKTPKLVLPLPPERCSHGPVPLKAMYVLSPPTPTPARPVTIRRLSGRRACLALISNTFNGTVCDPVRLARQLGFAASLARTVPVKSLSHARRLTALPALVEAIGADLCR